jgi:hypothetical protein
VDVEHVRDESAWKTNFATAVKSEPARLSITRTTPAQVFKVL